MTHPKGQKLVLSRARQLSTQAAEGCAYLPTILYSLQGMRLLGAQLCMELFLISKVIEEDHPRHQHHEPHCIHHCEIFAQEHDSCHDCR